MKKILIIMAVTTIFAANFAMACTEVDGSARSAEAANGSSGTQDVKGADSESN
jgi:Cu/Ag efflux protein CusF